MPTPQREPLRCLTGQERVELQRIARCSSERVDHVRRAIALLAVEQSRVYAHAAHASGLRSITTVADLVARFNRGGVAAIRIARGRGRKPTYQAAERARIVATAQRQPDRRTDGTWRPGPSARSSGACAKRGCRRWAPAPSDACCRMPAARTNGRARGVRRAPRSESERPVW